MQSQESLSKIQAAQELLARHQARSSLSAYARRMNLFPTPSKHHDYLLSELQKVETGETQNLMVNMPPGSAKSSYSSVVAPTYFMGKKPERLILGVSAVSELAEHFSRRVRNIVASAAYKALWGFGGASGNPWGPGLPSGLRRVITSDLLNATDFQNNVAHFCEF